MPVVSYILKSPMMLSKRVEAARYIAYPTKQYLPKDNNPWNRLLLQIITDSLHVNSAHMQQSTLHNSITKY